MRREYQITSRKGNAALRQFLAKEGTALVPMVELIEAGQLAVEELVGQLGQATLETVLAIRAVLETENIERQSQGKLAIRVGAGIETGICSVGNFGSDIRFDYTAIGSSVNMSARLESATKTTGCPVLLGPGFAERHGTGIEPVGRIELSGFSQPVQVFAPVGLKPAQQH